MQNMISNKDKKQASEDTRMLSLSGDRRQELTVLTMLWTITALPALICARTPPNNLVISGLGKTEFVVQTDIYGIAAGARVSGLWSLARGVQSGFRAIWKVAFLGACRCRFCDQVY